MVFRRLNTHRLLKRQMYLVGVARIIRTRIPVWVLERMRQLGISEIDILRSYPTLRSIDLVQAWSYASHHQSEIEKEIRENEDEESEDGSPLLR